MASSVSLFCGQKDTNSHKGKGFSPQSSNVDQANSFPLNNPVYEVGQTAGGSDFEAMNEASDFIEGGCLR